MNKKRGFTLAEVLITLGIIGVVAAITMPVLIQNYKKSVYVSQLKKSYSTISQGFTKMMADEGSTDFKDTEFYSAYSSGDTNKVKNIMQKYFNLEVCEDSSCNISAANASGPEIFGNADENTTAYLFNDGSAMQIPGSHSHDNGLVDINVDINGPQKPNTYGRDIFRFAIDSSSKVVPWCNHKYVICYINGDDGDPCTTEYVARGEGWACAQKIIAEGWQMNY